jgi:hypothetical protein
MLYFFKKQFYYKGEIRRDWKSISESEINKLFDYSRKNVIDIVGQFRKINADFLKGMQQLTRKPSVDDSVFNDEDIELLNEEGFSLFKAKFDEDIENELEIARRKNVIPSTGKLRQHI